MNITELDFDTEVLNAPGLTVVDFWAPWCGPCRTLAPNLERFAEETGESTRVVKVNIDENPVVATKYHVRSIPTLLFFKEGQVVDICRGAVSVKSLHEHAAKHQ